MAASDIAAVLRRAWWTRPPHPVAQPASRMPWRTPAAWGLAGFACGVVFWHLVGFWDFVSRIVFKTTEPVRILAQDGTTVTALDGRDQAAASAPAARCIELLRPAAGGPVEARPCVARAHLIKAGPLASRGDLALSGSHSPAPSVAGWTAQMEGERAAVPAAQ